MYRVFRILRATNRSFGLGVFFVYVAMFVTTFCLIFIFPPAALLMVFLGLAGLLVAVPTNWFLRTSEHLVARSLLRHGVCPGCADHHSPFRVDAADWHCERCGAAYLSSGAEKAISLSRA